MNRPLVHRCRKCPTQCPRQCAPGRAPNRRERVPPPGSRGSVVMPDRAFRTTLAAFPALTGFSGRQPENLEEPARFASRAFDL